MESLSADCTPLKHRYDSCFNSWFEGYLQPALDASRSSFSYESGSHVSTSSSSSGSSSPTESASPSSADPPRRQYLITSWASAFRQRPRHQEPRDLPYEDPLDSPQKDTTVIPSGPTKAVDTAGKTRAQIKAEDYERACGESWRTYQKCLKKAIAANQSLSTLLEQARDEHPLHRQEGLQGTPWDPNSDIKSSD